MITQQADVRHSGCDQLRLFMDITTNTLSADRLFDGQGRLVTAVLRPPKRPGDALVSSLADQGLTFRTRTALKSSRR